MAERDGANNWTKAVMMILEERLASCSSQPAEPRLEPDKVV